MRILIVTQHYWPETVGTAGRALRIATFLADRGHAVHVLTGVPNHPSMERFFHKTRPGHTRHRNVLLLRVPVIRFPRRLVQTAAPLCDGPGNGGEKGNHTPRMPWRVKMLRTITYGSWLASGTVAGALHHGGWDAVVAISPLPTGLLGSLLALRLATPLVFDVQDIWPDAAVQAGIVSSPHAVRVLEILESWCYTRATTVVVLSDTFAKRLASRGVPSGKIRVVPNAVDLSAYQGATGTAIRRRWGLTDEDTVVMYAGNLGVVQDLEVLLEAAQSLRNIPRIHFVIMGEGVDRQRLERLAARMGHPRVRFEQHRPADQIPEYLAASDICFLSLRPRGYTPGTVPSKLYHYLAAGKPVLNLTEGPAARIVDEADAGINLPPGDAQSLAAAILGLHSDPVLRKDLGANGRLHASHHASMSVEGARYLEVLEAVVHRGTERGEGSRKASSRGKAAEPTHRRRPG